MELFFISQGICGHTGQTNVRQLLAKMLDVSLSAEVISNYLLKKPMQYAPYLHILHCGYKKFLNGNF